MRAAAEAQSAAAVPDRNASRPHPDHSSAMCGLCADIFVRIPNPSLATEKISPNIVVLARNAGRVVGSLVAGRENAYVEDVTSDSARVRRSPR